MKGPNKTPRHLQNTNLVSVLNTNLVSVLAKSRGVQPSQKCLKALEHWHVTFGPKLFILDLNGPKID